RSGARGRPHPVHAPLDVPLSGDAPADLVVRVFKDRAPSGRVLDSMPEPDELSGWLGDADLNEYAREYARTAAHVAGRPRGGVPAAGSGREPCSAAWRRQGACSNLANACPHSGAGGGRPAPSRPCTAGPACHTPAGAQHPAPGRRPPAGARRGVASAHAHDEDPAGNRIGRAGRGKTVSGASRGRSLDWHPRLRTIGSCAPATPSPSFVECVNQERCGNGGRQEPALFHNSTQAIANVLPKAARCVLEGQTHNVRVKALALPLEEFFNT